MFPSVLWTKFYQIMIRDLLHLTFISGSKSVKGVPSEASNQVPASCYDVYNLYNIQGVPYSQLPCNISLERLLSALSYLSWIGKKKVLPLKKKAKNCPQKRVLYGPMVSIEMFNQ